MQLALIAQTWRGAGSGLSFSRTRSAAHRASSRATPAPQPRRKPWPC